MIAPLRKAHRTAWTVLAICILLVLVASLWTQRRTLTATGPSPEEETRIDEAIVGCWGTLPVRLTVIPFGGSEQIEEVDGLRTPPSGFATVSGDVASASNQSATVMEFSNGSQWVLQENDLVHLLLVSSTVSRIDVLESSSDPALYAYRVAGIVGPGAGLPTEAELIGPVSNRQPVELDPRPTPDGGASIVLYSLGHDETIGVVHLHRGAIFLRSCP